MTAIYYHGKGYIDGTEIHVSFTVIRGGKRIQPICSRKHIRKEVSITNEVTCKKCLKWIDRMIIELSKDNWK